MQQVYTPAALAGQIAALQRSFDEVWLVDPEAAVLLDPATLAPAGPLPVPLPTLDESGRGWLPLADAGPQQAAQLLFCQAVQVAGRPCQLMAVYRPSCPPPEDAREATACQRLLHQYREAMCCDYVTGACNRRYLREVYRPQAQALAAAGQPVAAVAVRVNGYADLAAVDGAADRCLNLAAGILRTALDPQWPGAMLARLEGGTFLAAAAVPAATLAAAVQGALAASRREFGLTLARRARFTAATAAADWAEADGWDALVALAVARLPQN